MREPIATTDREEAKRYLGGISEDRFQKLSARRIIQSIGHSWWAYTDLDKAIVAMQIERDGNPEEKPEDNTIDFAEAKKTKGRRQVRGKGRGSGHGQAKELLL